MYFHASVIVYCILFSSLYIKNIECINNNNKSVEKETSLEKLVKIFSKPGAFDNIDKILGVNAIDVSGIINECPKGEKGLDCRRNEARRSTDCPKGDCYCYSCAEAGPEMWVSCCRDSSKCCSHLAAACRNCDHPTLIPFCSRHFKKCQSQVDHATTMKNPLLPAIDYL